MTSATFARFHPDGRKIRFITNRLLRFGETYYSTRSADYNLTGGELDLNDQDRSESTGVLYPLAKLRLDKDKQLSLDLNMNPGNWSASFGIARAAIPRLAVPSNQQDQAVGSHFPDMVNGEPAESAQKQPSPDSRLGEGGGFY